MLKMKFFYDCSNNSYRCTISDKGIYRCVSLEKAKELIREIKFDDVIIDNNTIMLGNKKIEVLVEDVDKSNILMDLLTNNYQLIKDALDKTEKNITTSIFPLNIIKNRKLVMTAALASSIFLIGLGKIFSSSTAEASPSPIQEIVETSTTETVSVNNTIIVGTPGPEREIHALEKNPTVVLNHGSKVDSEKYKYAYSKYYKIVSKYANKWGLNPNHLMAILTQESGGKEINLMQFDFGSFAGGKIRGYNFETNKVETYFFTDDPNYTSNDKYRVIRSSDLNNAEINIDVGALCLRSNIDTYNCAIIGSLGYNQGPGNMLKIFAETQLKTGKTKDEILEDSNDISVYDYAYASGAGDQLYLEDVFQYYPYDILTYKTHQDGKVIEKTIILVNKEKEITAIIR